jgi:hypothetical protein
MAVLIEAISVVVKRASIEAKYPGGFEAFVRNAPNRTLCADTAVVRLGFMTPADVEAFVKSLQQHGLTYIAGGKAQDLIVVDQQRGFLVPCDWADFGHVTLEGDAKRRVSACRPKDAWNDPLVPPWNWAYEGSLSQQHDYVPTGEIDKKLKFLRREAGIDVYEETATGKEVYVSRAGRPQQALEAADSEADAPKPRDAAADSTPTH